MSPLWKLKYDLYLTQARKNYCKISENNRCQKCHKLDSTGHFLMCKKSNSQKIYEKFIDYCRKADPSITAEKIVHMDISSGKKVIYAIGWCLATITEVHYSKKKKN